MRLEKFFMLLTIFLSGSVYVVLFGNILSIIAIVVLMMLFIVNVELKVNKDLILTYLIISVSLGIVLVLHYFLVPYNNDPLAYTTFYARCVFSGLFILYLKARRIDILNLFQPILKLIATHAIIAFFLSFFVVNFLFNITTANIYTNSFIYLFFFNSSFDLFGITFYRNQGVFWEPGILQIYMNLLFFVSTFIFKERKWQIISVFLVFTTYSTTGIGVLLIQLLVVLFSNSVSKLQRTIIFLALVIVAIPLFILNYQSKLNDSSVAETDVTSSVLRIYDFMEGVDLTLAHPLTGVGLSEQSYQQVKNSRDSSLSDYSQAFIDNILDRRSSNSIMYFLSRFGALFSVIWFYLLYKQRIVTAKRFLFFIIIVFCNFSEPLIMTPFFVLLVCTGLYESFRFKGSQFYSLSKYAK